VALTLVTLPCPVYFECLLPMGNWLSSAALCTGTEKRRNMQTEG